MHSDSDRQIAPAMPSDRTRRPSTSTSATSGPANVCVVGAGLAGLVAALYLARQGRRVTLLEQAGEPGGRARTTDVDGFRLNLGPHALYGGGPAEQVLDELGITRVGHVPPSRGLAVRAGRCHRLPATPASLFRTSLLSWREKIQFARLFVELPRLDTASLVNLSVSEWIARRGLLPGPALLVQALARLNTYAHAPERISAGAALDLLRTAVVRGVKYLDGGWQTLVDGLRNAAVEAGVDLRTHARAAAVVIEGDAVRGLQLADGTQLNAAAVVLAVPPEPALELLPDPAAGLLREQVSRLTPLYAACLDVALRALPHPRATFALGIDAPWYLSVHSAVAQLAPRGGALIHVARYLAPGETVEPAVVERELTAGLDLVQPGWQAQLVHRRVLPRMLVTAAAPTAALAGTRGRPPVAVAGVAGLYLAGDWAGPEGTLADAALSSARAAARGAHAWLAQRVA